MTVSGRVGQVACGSGGVWVWWGVGMVAHPVVCATCEDAELEEPEKGE